MSSAGRKQVKTREGREEAGEGVVNVRKKWYGDGKARQKHKNGIDNMVRDMAS